VNGSAAFLILFEDEAGFVECDQVVVHDELVKTRVFRERDDGLYGVAALAKLCDEKIDIDHGCKILFAVGVGGWGYGCPGG